MPGGFHPFHAGHMALYNSAKKAFPDADVYVAASDNQKDRPFPFALKEKLARIAGVDAGHFVQVKSPFEASEITSKYDPDSTVLIFVKSTKNAKNGPDPEGPFPAEVDPSTGKLPLVTRGARKGQPVSNRLQYYKGNENNLQPMSKHSYLAYLPTVKFGPGITSASEIRKAWPTLDDRRKTAMVMSLYPASQKNQKLAANIVAMLDQVMGSQVAEAVGDDIWGPQGNFAGDTPINVGSVSMKPIKVGDIVKYFGEKAKVLEVSPTNNYARISANGKTMNVRLSDLKQLGQGMAEGERMKTASGMYRDQHTGVAYRGKTGQDGNDSYMTPDYLIQKYQERLAQIAAGPYKRPKEVAQLKSRIAKLQGHRGVDEGIGDIVKGIKRKVAGKEDPKDVEHTYGRIARSAIKHKTPDQAEKDISRWEKVNKVVNKEEVAEGAPIVVMPSPERLKKAEPPKQRYMGDIVPPTKPPSTEKRGVKGRPGQRPMPTYEDASLSVEELAHISDKALDDAYHYGRSTPGANFGWMANVQSAKAAKKLIDAGETDIEKISDAIHKGWNVTAAADYKGQLQLDTPTPEEKKLKRAKLAMQSYSQLPEEEKEKDRVVARALLQAIKGVAEDQGLGTNYPGTYEQDTEPFLKNAGHRTRTLTSEGNLSESADYLDEK